MAIFGSCLYLPLKYLVHKVCYHSGMTILSIVLASVALYIIGAVWYSALFGKTYAKVMGAESCTPEEMKKMQAEMKPAYIIQFFTTIVTVWMLSSQINFLNLHGAAPYIYGVFIWIGYILPTQISMILWSQTKKPYWFKQILISGGNQLVSVLVAVLILTLFR